MTWQRIDENTYIDDTLVTCAEYQLFIDEMREQGKYYQPDHWTSYQFPKGCAREPVLGVRRSDALDFCDWLTNQKAEKFKFRLALLEDEIIADLSNTQDKIFLEKKKIVLTSDEYKGILLDDFGLFRKVLEKKVNHPHKTSTQILEDFSKRIQNPYEEVRSSYIDDNELSIDELLSDVSFQIYIDEKTLENGNRFLNSLGFDHTYLLPYLINYVGWGGIFRSLKTIALEEVFENPLSVTYPEEVLMHLKGVSNSFTPNEANDLYIKSGLIELEKAFEKFIKREWCKTADSYAIIGKMDAYYFLRWYIRILSFIIIGIAEKYEDFTHRDMNNIKLTSGNVLLLMIYVEKIIEGFPADLQGVRLVKERKKELPGTGIHENN